MLEITFLGIWKANQICQNSSETVLLFPKIDELWLSVVSVAEEFTYIKIQEAAWKSIKEHQFRKFILEFGKHLLKNCTENGKAHRPSTFVLFKRKTDRLG